MYHPLVHVAHFVVTGRTLVQCDYDNWAASFVSWARRVPMLISLFLMVTGYATGQPLFAFLGWAITYTHALMYPLKYKFNILRLDPFCPAISTWAFPNDEMLYLGIILTFAIGYSIVWRQNRTIVQWIALAVVFIGPTVVLLWLDSSPWWQLVISFLIGAVAALMFLLWIWLYEDSFAILFNIWPFSVMYCDTVIVHGKHARAKYLETKKCIEDYERWQHSHISSPQAFSILSSKCGATKYQ